MFYETSPVKENTQKLIHEKYGLEILLKRICKNNIF